MKKTNSILLKPVFVLKGVGNKYIHLNALNEKNKDEYNELVVRAMISSDIIVEGFTDYEMRLTSEVKDILVYEDLTYLITRTGKHIISNEDRIHLFLMSLYEYNVLTKYCSGELIEKIKRERKKSFYHKVNLIKSITFG